MKNRGVTFILGIIIFAATIVLAILRGTNLVSFVDIPSILCVAGVGGGLGLAAYKGGGFLGYVEACKKYFIPAGILGTVIGVILTLRIPLGPSQIGRGMAVAILTTFYGIVFYCLADALLTNAEAPEAQV